ncbi:MAG: DUF58 domain-containing protein [Xanthomonadales bacterium]|nr:DUF58 domain-containing protein [Xanthomonadales bacterium]
MSSRRSSAKPPFPEGDRARSWVDAAQVRFAAWLRRRGPVHPPLTLGYRQIYILPTRFGWLVGLLLFAMLLGSLNFNNNLGLFTTFLVAGIGLLSMHIAHRNLDGVRVAGCVPGQTFAGAPLELSITLRDTRDRARRGLVAESKRLSPAAGVDLAASASAETALSIPTRRRGWMEIPRIRLRTRHPLGWFEAWSWFWPEHKVLVWPRPADQAPPLLTSGSSDSRNRSGDESDEFHGLRDWREGDPLHRIAWKASQRHQHLLARQFTRPERDRIILRLTDAPGRSLEERISILARWVMEAERNEFEYGMELGATTIEPGSGEAHRIRCLDALGEFG